MFVVRHLSRAVFNTAGTPDRGCRNSNPPSAGDIWSFTSPTAKEAYRRAGRLFELEQDIRTYVKFNDRWDALELEYQREVDRLVQTCTLIPQPAFGHLSPHPVVYLAVDEAAIWVSGKKFPFKAGDEIVFEPWLARLYHPGLSGPLRIGRMKPSNLFRLCREEFPLLAELDPSGLSRLHALSGYQSGIFGQPKTADADPYILNAEVLR